MEQPVRHPSLGGRGAVDAGLSDAQLVRAAQTGDRAAWAELYRRFAPVVHAVLLCRARRADAEDLTQDVFVRAMRRLGDVREGASVGGWLAAIARNAAISLARRPRHERLGEAEPAFEERERGGESEEASRILEVIRLLPEAYRETLVMRLVEGLTGPEIAERMGMTHGSVRVNLHRGMELLRAKLGIAGEQA